MGEKSAEILCIGTELLMGDVVNTNAAYIARKLADMGIGLYHQTVVGDNPERLRACLKIAFSRADIVITTGGLGPTYDDLSKETVAAYFGRELVLDEKSLWGLEEYFRRLGREMTENNKKQAMMPAGCTIFQNRNGTAPGCAIEQEGKTCILLPGPPKEMCAMFESAVAPFLMKYTERRFVSHNLHFFGIGEAALEQLLHNMMVESQNPTVAPYAKEGEVLLRVTASAETKAAAEAMTAPVIEKIKAAAGDYLYGIDVGDLQTAVVRTLAGKGLKMAAAESCTGGLISKRITDVSGASQVFEFGVCTYSDRIKHETLGVNEQTILESGAVSAETAREMARGVRLLSGAEIGVAVTGNAGPVPSENKPVGLVYVAVDSAPYADVIKLNLARKGDDARGYIRQVASSHALSLVLKAAGMF